MASNVTYKDASGTTQTGKTTETAGVHTPHQNVDAVIPGTGATNLGKAIDAVAGANDVGVMALAKRRDTPATITPADGDVAPLHVDSMGRLQIAPAVNPTPATSGGCLAYHRKATADTNTAVIKASAGQVYGIELFNFKAATVYLKFYDKATTPNLASDVPVLVIPWFQLWARTVDLPLGVQFSTGIAIAITAGIGDTDTTALAANDCVLNVLYK